MIARRDLLLGAVSLAAAATAYELKPRKRQVLLGKVKMASIVPETFGEWSAVSDPSIVTADTTGKLASQLYSELIQRVYSNAQTGASIMMLIAYGDTQSDLLQLHRPESCYPAVGFNLALSAPTNVALSNHAELPGRRVIAMKGDRQENIVYWTRLGEYLPVSSGDQKLARLRSALKGYIPDGALFRFSSISTDAKLSFDRLDGFIAELVAAIAPRARPAVLGTRLANALGG